MLFSIGLLIFIFFVAYRAAPREKKTSYKLMIAVARFWELFGVRRPFRFEPLVVAGEYETAMSQIEKETFLDQYLHSSQKKELKLGGAPKVLTPGDQEGKQK